MEGMDFWECVRKGGNDERAEGFPIQNLQPLVKLRPGLFRFNSSMLCQHELYNPLQSVLNLFSVSGSVASSPNYEFA